MLLQDLSNFTGPPAEPGAFIVNRSKRSVTRPLCGLLSHLKVARLSATSVVPSACLLVPGAGCTLG